MLDDRFALQFQWNKMKSPSGTYSQSVPIVQLIKNQSISGTAESVETLLLPFRRFWSNHKLHEISNTGERRERTASNLHPNLLLSLALSGKLENKMRL